MLLFAACVEDKTAGPIGQIDSAPNLSHNGVFIVNEGGFTLGQASLSFIDFVEDSIYNNVFQAINNRALGDVFQSMYYADGKAFLVINNSQKIEVVDSITFESLATIDNLNSPRQVLAHDDKLFVTSLYSDNITVLDGQSYTVVDTLYAGGWTEQMLVINNELWVTVRQTFSNNTPDKRKGLVVFDLENMTSTYLPLAQGANSMALDTNDDLWVLCDGGIEEELGGLYKLDVEFKEVKRIINFKSIEYSGGSLQMDASKEQMYFIITDIESGVNTFDIMQLDINATSLPNTVFYDGEQKYLYGFKLDEANDFLFVNDAVGLLQEGFCYQYELTTLREIRKYKTGIFNSMIVVR